MACILLAAIHSPCTAARSMLWALREMGHDVITVGPIQNGMDWAAHKRFYCYEWNPDVPLMPNPDDPHHYVARYPAMLDKLHGDVDMLLQIDRCVSGASFDCPNVLYAIDNHVGPYNAHDEFNHIFIGHSWGYMSELPQTRWLPAGYDPRYHYVIAEKAERPIDVLLIGNPYPQRRAMVKVLRAAGINIIATNGPIWEEYNALYNQAKIALVVSNCGDLSGRVFEHMAAGCLVICDRVRDLAGVGFREYEHYLGYDGAAECAEQIRKALAMWPHYRDIAQRGNVGVKFHTWDDRIRQILETLANGSHFP